MVLVLVMSTVTEPLVPLAQMPALLAPVTSMATPEATFTWVARLVPWKA